MAYRYWYGGGGGGSQGYDGSGGHGSRRYGGGGSQGYSGGGGSCGYGGGGRPGSRGYGGYGGGGSQGYSGGGGGRHGSRGYGGYGGGGSQGYSGGGGSREYGGSGGHGSRGYGESGNNWGCGDGRGNYRRGGSSGHAAREGGRDELPKRKVRKLSRDELPKRKILFETSAPPDRNVVLVRIPAELYWKFAFDQNTPRYWLKLTDDDMERYKPRPGTSIRENCPEKHGENCHELESTLRRLLQASLQKIGGGFNFRCEARLGKVVWRASTSDLDRQFCIRDITKHDKEFYTRTTTATDDMVRRFQSLATKSEGPEDVVVLHFKAVGEEYRVFLVENPHGIFTLHFDDVLAYGETIFNNRSDLICIGRSHDIRFASDSRSKEILQKSVPHVVRKDVERIATSVERNASGQLKMMLSYGFVKTEHVRQKRRWNFTTCEGFQVHFFELKESITRSLNQENEVVFELEEKENQEIEVELTRIIEDEREILDTLQAVQKLIDFSMDVLDMAEEHKDPFKPF